MNRLIRTSFGRPRAVSGSGFILSTLAAFALCWTPKAFGVSPPPDGGYAGNNTAEGTSALFSLSSGIDNSGLGFQALYHDNDWQLQHRHWISGPF